MLVLVKLLNFGLSLLMWLILGRAALRVLAGGRPNPVGALFDRATQPVFDLTRRALPFVAERWAPPVALLLLAAARVLLVVLYHPAAGR